jgi:hypothetical protein
MEFRWVAWIALWTLLSGPILGTPTGSASKSAPGKSGRAVSAKASAAR